MRAAIVRYEPVGRTMRFGCCERAGATKSATRGGGGEVVRVLVARWASRDLVGALLTKRRNSATTPARVAALWSMVPTCTPAANTTFRRGGGAEIATKIGPGHDGNAVKWPSSTQIDKQWAEPSIR